MYTIYGMFGLILGSFLNVLVLRHNAHSVLGRSGCAVCGAALSWYELIPILSWVFQKGVCRTCGSNISIQYPLVELAVASWFVLIASTPISLLEQGIMLFVGVVLIAIAVYDIRHTIIPDQWVWGFVVAAVVYSSVVFATGERALLDACISGIVIAAPIWALWFFSRGMAMGFGDVKLALGIGYVTGLSSGVYTLGLAFIFGAVVGVSIIAYQRMRPLLLQVINARPLKPYARTLTMKSEIPFGPFLVAAVVIVWYAQQFDVLLMPW